MLERFKTLSDLQQSRTVPAIVRRNSFCRVSGHFRCAEALALQIPINFRHLDGFAFQQTAPCDGTRNYAAPPAPTADKAIFTPGPMVDEMEIFFT